MTVSMLVGQSVYSSHHIDVWGGTSADVPRFGLRKDSVSSAIATEHKFSEKSEENGDFFFFAYLLLDF